MYNVFIEQWPYPKMLKITKRQKDIFTISDGHQLQGPPIKQPSKNNAISPEMQQILKPNIHRSLRHLIELKSYNYLNVKVHFSKLTSII